MDPWDHIRRACADTRSGSLDIAVRASLGIAAMSDRREVGRAARALVRAHPAMAPLWRLCAAALDGASIAAAAEAYADRLVAESEAAADALRWVLTRRSAIVLTHSASGTVARALDRVRSRVALVVCTASLPGGEGRTFARRLQRDGFHTETIADAETAAACRRAHIVLVGADAVSVDGVVNKVGTRPLALAAQEADVGCYAIAPTSKVLPFTPEAPHYETTPLHLFDAILTERGPQRPAAIKRAAARIELPPVLGRLVRT